MKQEFIFYPFFGMMLLTAAVWLYMYYQRLTYILGERINPQSFAVTSKAENVPDRVRYPSDNLKNLFELPVIFYALCIYLYATHQVNAVYLGVALCYLLMRVAHSVIHCSYNKVVHRFYVYMASSIVLWLFVMLALVDLVQG